MKNIIHNEDIHRFILDEIEKTPFNDANIITLSQKNSTLKTFLNKELRKSLEEYIEYDLGVTSHNDYKKDDFNVMKNLTQFIIYNDISYYPSVYTLHDVKETTEKSAIAIGEQVDADDNIQGWVGKQLILLNEKSISRYNGNVILIGNGDYNLLKISNSSSQTSFNTPQKVSQNTATDKALGDDIYVTSFRIKGCQFRYERFGASEVRGFFRTYVYGNFHDPATIIGTTGWNRSSDEVCNQTANVQNRYFSGIHFADITSPLFNLPGNGNLYNSPAIIGFYERDGYSNPKVVLGYSPTGTYAEIQVRMKYSHEWYVNDVVDSFLPYYTGTGDIHHYDPKKALFETQIQ